MVAFRHSKQPFSSKARLDKSSILAQHGLNGVETSAYGGQSKAAIRTSSKRTILASASTAPAALDVGKEFLGDEDKLPVTSELRRSKRAKLLTSPSQPVMQIAETGRPAGPDIQNAVVDEIAASVVASTGLGGEKKPAKRKAAVPKSKDSKTKDKKTKTSREKQPKQKSQKELAVMAGASTCREIWSECKLDEALCHLKKADPKLGKLIDTSGPAHPERLLPKGCKNVFSTLTRTIMGQQLATSAARIIYGRFLDLIKKDNNTPAVPKDVLSLDEDTLKSVGLSRQKASYVKSLAEYFESGELSDGKISGLDDQTLITELTKVKGIGRWTVDMFAMFDLGHTDVLPVGDLGVRNGMRYLYGLKDAPSIEKMQELTESWRPYRSLGSFYMWRALDVEKQEQNVAKLVLAAKKGTPKKSKKVASAPISAVPL